jgi:hypothetical protein
MRLIEVGGWHPHLPAAELSAVAGRSLFQVAKRVYALPGDVDVARLAYSYRSLSYVGGGRDLRPPAALYAEVTGSYAVRVHDPEHLLPHSARVQVIDEVWHSLPGRKVNLRDPAHEVNVYVTARGLHWALLLDEPVRGRLSERDPMRRPFFRSVLVPWRRARCLVNLTGVQPGQRFLDPFCGTGALLGRRWPPPSGPACRCGGCGPCTSWAPSTCSSGWIPAACSRPAGWVSRWGRSARWRCWICSCRPPSPAGGTWSAATLTPDRRSRPPAGCAARAG